MKHFEITKRMRNNIERAILLFCLVSLFSLTAINVTHAGAELSVSITASNSVNGTNIVSVGQGVKVTMTVENTGNANANDVEPSEPNITGNGSVSKVFGPKPQTIPTIPAGEKRNFEWTYKADAAGTVILSGNASGIDAETGGQISSESADSNEVKIQTPVNLKITALTANPMRVSVSQEINITMTLTNLGQAKALAVTPSITPSDSDVVSKDSEPSDYVDLAENSTHTFEWIYKALSPDTVTFSGEVSGTDINSGESIPPVSKTSDQITIESPAHLDITEFTAESEKVSIGQEITVTMIIRNDGGATAKNVTPSIDLTDEDVVQRIESPPPDSIDLSGNSEHTFTWTYRATSSGEVTFSGSASGIDANSNKDLSTGSKSASVTIQIPANLSIATLTAEHPRNQNVHQITEGQNITITMVVENTGEATANNVTLSVELKEPDSAGHATYESGPNPPPAIIEGGRSKTFTWNYTTEEGDVGTVVFSGIAKGKDANTRNDIKLFEIKSNEVVIQTQPQLIATLIAENPDNKIKTQISEGQIITVTMTVENTGDATATDVKPSELKPEGDGHAKLASGPIPSESNIPSGESITFTWTYSTNTENAGSITFSGGAGGVDFNTRNDAVVSEVTSEPVIIQTPADLEIISLAAENPDNPDPTIISEKQTITVTMKVKNNGQAKALDVKPTIKYSGTRKATLSISPSPTDIEGEAEATFKWICDTDIGDAGVISFSGKVSGIDFNSKKETSDSETSNRVTIQKPPALLLISRFSAEHPGNSNVTRISEGQTIICAATVTNGGEGKATGVSIATPTWPGRGNATLVPHPSPASADIKGGKKQTYTWTWRTKSGTAGLVKFSAEASGTDYNSGDRVIASGYSNSILIQTPPKLNVILKAEPNQISEGQDITITMTVTNEDLSRSQATAMNVVPSALSLGGSTGHAALYSGPDPSSATIKEGENQSFKWIYKTTAGNHGSVTFYGTVSGDDENTTNPIPTAEIPSKMPSNLVLIQIPAALEISEIKAEPERISEGQQDITVTMTVKNTGEATALGVFPEELTPEGVIDNIGEVKETPIAKDVAGGKSETFKWVYETKQFQTIPNYEIDDTITFTGIATGTDYNSNDKIPEAKNTSNPVVIQMPADLQVKMDLSTPKIFEGQSFQVKVTAHNVGETDAENVRSLESEWSGTGKVSLVSSPKIHPLIPGGGQHTFVWEYSTNEEESRGTVTFEGKVEGNDFNSKNNKVKGISESPVEINIDVQPSRSMSLRPKITVNKVKVSVGQKLKITMTVTNERMIDVAVNVVPSLEITGTGNIARLTEIDIQPKRIEPEKTARYIWEYDTSEDDVGIISFRGDASGKDEETGDPIGWFEKVDSESVIVQRPAKLISQISIQQKEISEGQEFTVTMTVTNDGEATTEEVKPPEWSTIGAGVAKLLSGPVPASIREMLGGESHQYTWTYKAITEGNISFKGKASGNAANSSVGVESKVTTSEPSEIVHPIDLEAKITVSPEQISEGQTLTVTMTVTNTGGAGAKEVVPSPLVILGKAAKTSGPKLESGPHPTKADIPAGDSKKYTWRYTTTTGDAAKVAFSGNATGLDANSEGEEQSLIATSSEVTIQTPAHLVSQVEVTPGQLSEKQIITVTLTVTNDGQATAKNVTPSNPELMRGRLINAKPIKGPTPKSVDELKTGAEQEFTWEYKTQRGDAGIVVFTANASGYDENSQLPSSWEGPGVSRKVQSDKTLSNDVHIQIPAHLEVSLATSHQRMSAGQSVDVTMTVKNIGQATALDVKPSLMILDKPVEAAPEPVISDILSGQSLKFQWTNIAITNEEEKIILKGQAEGIDENSNEPIESSSEVSVEIVQGPTLECKLMVELIQLSEGQDIPVEMTVKNTGQVIAQSVIPELTIEGGGFAELVGKPQPSIDIGPEKDHTFKLRYATAKGKSAGKITFEGKAKGVNELSSEIVESEVYLMKSKYNNQPI